MEEQVEQTIVNDWEVTADDRLWALLVWLPFFFPFAGVIALLLEDKKERPFIRYHAITGLVVGLLGIILGVACIGVIMILAMFYWGYKAYQGEWVKIPFLTDLIKGQGWVEAPES